MKTLAEDAAALLGGALRNAHPIHGGCLSEIVRITLSDGREAIVKAAAIRVLRPPCFGRSRPAAPLHLKFSRQLTASLSWSRCTRIAASLTRGTASGRRSRLFMLQRKILAAGRTITLSAPWLLKTAG